MSLRRAAFAGGSVLALYLVAFWFLADRSGLPPIGPTTMAMLAVAVVLQMGAVWLFGEMFRDGLRARGRSITTGLGFRAALVGSTVARLLPAGGAVTPVAMAWTVRRQAPDAGGAAMRATGLNYGGLLVATGACLLLVAPTITISPWAETSWIVAAFALVVGMLVLLGASHLGALSRRLPGWFRSRFGRGLADQPVDVRSHGYLWGRVAAEVAVLGVVLAAFGIDLGPAQLAAAFGISQIAAGIPGTPGGAGFAEAGLVGALSVFGVATMTALAPVLLFRVVSYWLPAGAGLVAGTTDFLRSAD